MLLMRQLKNNVPHNRFAHADVILQETSSDMIVISGHWKSHVVFFKKKYQS